MKPLAVTLGDPAGIGPEVVFKALEGLDVPVWLFGSRAWSGDIPDGARFIDVGGSGAVRYGEISAEYGRVALDSIDLAVEAVAAGDCSALVTAPIHKQSIAAAGSKFPGHTELLAHLTNSTGPVMMLAHGGLRAVPVTIHVPIKDVPGLLTKELIVETIRVVAHDLRHRFGIANPQIGVAGLNPHAGEGGAIGREELEIIGPAVAQLQFEGIGVEGPLPADTLFYPTHWARFDAVVAMYHDQALIPIKTVAFEDAVNVTLGLPIVRTSPDHGTAFDLAGTGRASVASFLAAIEMADAMTASP